MSWDEHVMLIAHTVNSFGSKLQVIGNTGSNSTREALHATEQGFAVGMDAALQINPYYGKTSLDGLIAHFSAVLDEGPTIIYNVPSRTGRFKLMLRLFDDWHPLIDAFAHLCLSLKLSAMPHPHKSASVCLGITSVFTALSVLLQSYHHMYQCHY